MTKAKLAPALNLYQAISHHPGFIVRGPGVRVRVFNENREIALVIRDACSQAFAAGKRDRRTRRYHRKTR